MINQYSKTLPLQVKRGVLSSHTVSGYFVYIILSTLCGLSAHVDTEIQKFIENTTWKLKSGKHYLFLLKLNFWGLILQLFLLLINGSAFKCQEIVKTYTSQFPELKVTSTNVLF